MQGVIHQQQQERTAIIDNNTAKIPQQISGNSKKEFKNRIEYEFGQYIEDQSRESFKIESEWNDNVVYGRENEEAAQHVTVGNDTKSSNKVQDNDPVTEITSVQQLVLLQEDENKRPFKL